MAESRPPHLLAVSEQIYRALLYLYPRAHRRDYGRPMAQTFRDLARDALRRGGGWGLLQLWLRTLADLARSLPREHLAALAEGGLFAMEDRPVTPLPWWQVALATLPGLVILAGIWPGMGALMPLARLGLFTVAGATSVLRRFGLPLCLLPVALAWARTRRFPAWGLTALGAVAGVAMAGPYWLLLGLPAALATAGYVVTQWRRGLVPNWISHSLVGAVGLSLALALTGIGDPLWTLTGVATTLLVALLGLPLSRRHGLAAGLAVVTAGFALWQETFDLTYDLAATVWGNGMLAVLGLLLLVVGPVWALRTRSTHGQARGLLVPATLALAGVTAINATVRADPAILERILNLPPFEPWAHGLGGGSWGRIMLLVRLLRDGLTALQLLLALALTVVLYDRRGSRQSEVAEGEIA